MGAILDSAKNIRQDEKDSSRQAYKTEEKLEKDKDEGVKMTNAIANAKSEESIKFNLVYNGRIAKYRGQQFNVEVVGGLEQKIIFVFPEPQQNPIGFVPPEIREELSASIRNLGYKPTIIIYPSPWDIT